MMNLKDKINQILKSLNVLGECQSYGIPLWQCPPFLFLLMGLVIIASIFSAYFLGTRYIDSPFIVFAFVSCLAIFLLILAFIIVRSFEKLAQANRIKSEFINIISHQIRTPISSLKWLIDVLTDSSRKFNQDEQKEYLNIIKENIERMRLLVSDLIIVSRIDSGSLNYKKEEFDLVSLVEDMIKKFEGFAQASNVKIQFYKDDNIPKVFADQNHIKTVLENLFHNAIRYIYGGGLVKVVLRNSNKGVYFEIEDNGVGIPQEDQKYVFQKFFRARNIMRHQTQGSGLGLYIVKSIIDLSRGKIGFESEENKGSKFWFILPTKK
jgi:signal transduction histidine kinase